MVGCAQEPSAYKAVTVEFLTIINSYTPLFWQKMLISVLYFIHTRKNETIILLFVQLKGKHGEMTFLMSRSASKQVRFALGVNRTARDTVKVRVPT